MKKRSFLRGIALPVLLSAFLAVLCGGAVSQEQEDKGLNFREIAAEVEKRLPDAEEKLLTGVAAVEQLLKSSKTEAGQMTGKWIEILEQSFASPVMKELGQLRPLLKLAIDSGLHEAMQASRDKMKKGNAPVSSSSGKSGITLPIARDIHKDAEELLGFAQEIQSAGEAVAWTLKVNRHIESLEFDIGNAPARVGAYVDDMKLMSASLADIRRKANQAMEDYSKTRGSLAELKGEMSRYLTLTMTMKYKTQNAAVSLVNTAKYLEPETGYVIPAAELKRMEVLAEYWKDGKNLYPLLRQDIAEGVARWAPHPKAKWSNYLESKKEFNKVYSPLLQGNLFQGIPLFEGKKYTELSGVVLDTEMTLRSVIAAIAGEEKNVEVRRSALVEDNVLTRKEQEEIRKLEAEYGPEREKSLRSAVYKAAGGYARVVELERFLENSEIKDGAYERAKEELDSLLKRRHPDQRAADSAMQTFYKQLPEAQRRVDSIIADHGKRKKDLGLQPVLKEAKLAREKQFDTLKPRSQW